MDLDRLNALFPGLTPVNTIVVAPKVSSPRIDPEDLKQRILDIGAKTFYDALSGQDGKVIADSITYRCWHHDDDHASLCVAVEHGGYQCLACGETNNLLKAWMYIRSVNFPKALEQITEWVGGSLTLPPAVVQSRSMPSVKKKIKGKIEARYSTLEPKVSDDLPMWQRSLSKNRPVRAKLKDHYGIDYEAAEMFGLGWSSRENRLMIPVYTGGRLTNIRKHDIMRANCAWKDKDGKIHRAGNFGRTPVWDVPTCRKVGKRGSKVTGVWKFNSNNLFPSGTLDSYRTTGVNESGEPNPWVCITGGELKAILLNANLIPAVTFTGGELAFVRQWLEKFRGMRVDICLDADEAGRKGAKKLAKALFGIAAEVRIVNLPFGDVNDYYRTKEWNFSDWYDLPREGHVKSPYDMSPVPIAFDQIHNVKMAERAVTLNAVVAGGTDRAKFVICGAKVTCVYGEKHAIPNCKKCSLPSNGFERSTRVPSTSIITLSKAAPSKQEKIIREDLLGVPPRCRHPEYKFERARIMPVLLAPDSEVRGVDWSSHRHFIVPVYYLGATTPRDNEPVKVTGRVCADPITSEATMIADTIKPSKKSLHSARMSKETEDWLNGLSLHSPQSMLGAMERADAILKDVELSITRIYNQRTMLRAYLNLFFMPIRFRMFGDTNGKVSPELLVLGDARQGKTTVADKLMRHFGAGSMVDAEGATYVGLVGGRNEFGSAGKVFAWGALPMNNGGLVFLDEIDGLVEDGIFGKLTSIRSSGVAQRSTAGGDRRTSAALRMIMASNPVGARRLAQYDSLMYAVRELIKKPADLARFELIVGVYKLNSANFRFEKHELQYTETIAREHLRWAWQQEPSLSDEVSQYCSDMAKWLCSRFENLPTLEPTEAHWKVGRMACAYAALAFSRSDDGKVLVTKSHVDVATNFINDTYSTPEWKISVAIGHGNIKSLEVTQALDALGGEEFARILMTRGSVRRQELWTAFTVAETVMGMVDFDRVIATLTLFNDCLVDRRGGYHKTDQFRRWLDDTYPARSVA